MSNVQASWQKSEDGSWLVKVTGGIAGATGLGGQRVTVYARSGKAKTVTLAAQIAAWNAGRAALYAVEAQRVTNGAKPGRPIAAVPRHRPEPTAECPNPVVRETALRAYPGWTVRQYHDGVYDAIHGPHGGISWGCESFQEAVAAVREMVAEAKAYEAESRDGEPSQAAVA